MGYVCQDKLTSIGNFAYLFSPYKNAHSNALTNFPDVYVESNGNRLKLAKASRLSSLFFLCQIENFIKPLSGIDRKH